MALSVTHTHAANNSNAATTTTVTATITANSLVIITIVFESNNANTVDAATPITVSGTAMTWTKINDNATVADNSRCSIRQYAAYSSGAGSRTFTHTKTTSTSANRRMSVAVIEGAIATLASAVPSGNRISTTSPVANASQSVTPAGAGSMLIGAAGDWNAGNAYVALTGNSINTNHVAAKYTTAYITPTTQPLPDKSAFTWGASCVGGSNTWAVVEVVPAPKSPPIWHRPPMFRRAA